MRLWIGIVIAFLLSGCGGQAIMKTGGEACIYHSPKESIEYSPSAISSQPMTLAHARDVLPKLLIHEGVWITLVPQNGCAHDESEMITQVRVMRSGNMELSTSRKSLAIPLKDINFDVIRIRRGIGHDIFVINLQKDKAQIYFSHYAFGETPLVSDEDIKSIANALYFLKHQAMSDEDESAFADTARSYRVATTKPVLPEAARRLKIQAEDAVQDKKFEDAADLYEEAIHLVPWWPAGHFNLAVISSETGDFELAVREMKRYLLLVPDAPDAHDAQNYIYKWERKAEMPN
jgi:tetratricopeptide (TPR) repeat protein